MISSIKISYKTLIGTLFLVFGIVLCGCAAYKYVSPYGTYDHEQHEKILLDAGMDCFVCHKVDIREKDVLKRLELLKASLKQKGGSSMKFDAGLCHTCHVDEKTRVASAPSNCVLCHEDLGEIIPADHAGLWKTTHGPMAIISDAKCMQCHQQWFCSDCHTARDMTANIAHRRTFKLSHIAAAMADPASCSACHVTSFCRDCHTKR